MILTDQRQWAFMRDWTTRRLASWTLLAYLVVAALVVPGLRAGEPMTLEQVKAKLEGQREKLRSFRVDYRIKAEPLVDVKLLGRWRMLHFYPYVREDHIAFKGGKQYWHKMDLPQKLTFKYVQPEVDPDAPADVQKQQREAKEAYERRVQEYAKLGAKGKALRDAEEGMDSPGYDLMMGFNGKYAWSYDGTRKLRALYDPPVQDLGFFQSEYLMSVGLRLEDRTMTPKMLAAMAQREYLLPDALDLHEYWVRPKTERVDGADCLVLETKYQSPYLKDVTVVDRLWFDLDHGLALRRRDQVYDGRLGARWLTFKLDGVVPGYWLPRETVWQRCAPPYAPKQYDNKPVISYRMSVLRWSANDVKDELFEAPKEEKQQPAQPSAVTAGAVSIQVGDNVHVSAGRDSILHKEVVIAADPRNPKRLFAASMCQSTDRLSVYNLAGWHFEDGGRTWQRSFERKGVGEESFADPAAAFGSDGVLHFVNIRFTRAGFFDAGSYLQFARSADGGKTWRNLARTDEWHDRPWLAVDVTGGRHNGRLYCNTSKGVLASTDGGRSWGPPRFWKLPEGHHSSGAANAIVLSDGTIVVLHRTTIPLAQVAGRMAAGSSIGLLKAHRSADGGETFDRGKTVTELFRNGLETQCGNPMLAADPGSKFRHDRLYAVWCDRISGRLRVLFSSSRDGGRSWSTSRPISDERRGGEASAGYDAFLPAVAVNRTGVVAVSWYDTRGLTEDEAGWNVRLTASADGGDSWAQSVVVSSHATRLTAEQRKKLPADVTGVYWKAPGDTAGLAADAAGGFHPVWIDARGGTPQVYTALVSVHTGTSEANPSR